MTLHTLPFLIRGTVNPGVLAGTAVATAEDDKHNHNASTHSKIIGIVISVSLLLILIVGAVCYDRSRKRKARQGEKLREIPEEEARPMVQQEVEVPRPLVLQQQQHPGYFPPQGETMYGGGGYGPGEQMPVGGRGTDFYRNQ